MFFNVDNALADITSVSHYKFFSQGLTSGRSGFEY